MCPENTSDLRSASFVRGSVAQQALRTDVQWPVEQLSLIFFFELAFSLTTYLGNASLIPVMFPGSKSFGTNYRQNTKTSFSELLELCLLGSVHKLLLTF